MSAPRLLIGDKGHDEWVRGLIAAIGVPPQTFTISDDGAVVRKALVTVPSEYKLVVLGDQLSTHSALDALYWAAEDRKTQGPIDVNALAAVALLTEVRDDVELLALLRRKGVEHFVYRDVSIEATARRFRDLMFAGSRVAPRLPVNIKATVTLGDSEAQGTIEDLSMSGARIVVAARKVRQLPQVGERLTLQADVELASIRCAAVIRRIDLRKALLRDHYVLGTSFVELDFEARKALATALEIARADDSAPADEA